MYVVFSLNLKKFTPDRKILHRHVCGVCDKYEVWSYAKIAKIAGAAWFQLQQGRSWLKSAALDPQIKAGEKAVY